MNKNILFYILIVIIIFCGDSVLAADKIHQAAKDGNIKALIALLEEIPGRLNQQDGNGKMALHHACSHNKDDVAKYLIEKGADLNIKDQDNTTPLLIASSLGNLELVKILIKKGEKS